MDLRILFAFFLGSLFIAFLGSFMWNTLNQRLFIPLARWLRFKIDDTKKVQKEVDKIMGGDDDAKKEKPKTKNVSK